MMDNTLHLVSNRERCEGKRAVAIFWLGLCSIITTSLDSKPVSAVQKPHTLPLISLVLCGYIWLTVCVSVLEIVHRVYLFLTNLCFRLLLQTVITNAVWPQWYTLPNVYITKKSTNIFACWPDLDSLTTRKECYLVY